MLEVSVLMVAGEVATRGDRDNTPPGCFCCRGFSACDICPNRYNNSQKTHSKFTNCKAAVCDYFPLNAGNINSIESFHDEMSSLESLLSVTYHLFHSVLGPPAPRCGPFAHK